MAQTYDNYYREYYKKNAKRINAKTQAYRVQYSREYYLKNKAACSERMKAYRLRKKEEKAKEVSNSLVFLRENAGS